MKNIHNSDHFLHHIIPSLQSSWHRLSQQMMQCKQHPLTFSYDLSKILMCFPHTAGAPLWDHWTQLFYNETTWMSYWWPLKLFWFMLANFIGPFLPKNFQQHTISCCLEDHILEDSNHGFLLSAIYTLLPHTLQTSPENKWPSPLMRYLFLKGPP